MKISTFTIATIIIMTVTACNNNTSETASGEESSKTAKRNVLPARTAFQQTIDGKQTDLFILKNKNCLAHFKRKPLNYT